MTLSSRLHAETLNASSSGEGSACRSSGFWFDASAFEGALPTPLWVQRSDSQGSREMKSTHCSEARLPGRSAQNVELAVSAWRNAARSCVERSEDTRQHVRCSDSARHHVRDSEGTRQPRLLKGTRVLKRHSVRHAAAQAVNAPNQALQRTAPGCHACCFASLGQPARQPCAVAELGALGHSDAFSVKHGE